MSVVAAATFDSLPSDLARIDHLLGKALEQLGIEWHRPARPVRPAIARAPSDYALPGLRRAIAAFGLAPFDCDVLLLALAPEVDDRYAAAFGALHRNPALVRPSVGLVARLLAEASGVTVSSAVQALSPASRLFEHQLVRLVGDGPHATRSLALPPRVWQQLVDDRPPSPITMPAQRLDELVLHPVTLARVRRVIAALRTRRDVLIAIHGPYGRNALASALAAELGWQTLPFAAADGRDPARIAEVAREGRWWSAAVIAELGCELPALTALCAATSSPVIAAVEQAQLRELVSSGTREVVEIAIHELEPPDRQQLWQRQAAELQAEDLAAIAARYRFGPARIATTIALARGRAQQEARPLTAVDVAEACHLSATSSGMAQRVDTSSCSDDLVVSPLTRRELDLVESAARHGHHVFAPGGGGARIRGGGGLVTLFAGPPGTGKTLSAQILARRLELVLMRVDLSRVVNKYIGETEKHLDQVFKDAEVSGALLFFDEADALFGKRTEVRDAHDRYANLETSYLLQRLEVHRGVTILATNFKQNLDAAFMRRIQLVIDFAMPSCDERRRIWERHLEPAALAPDVDLDFLSTFAMSGGDIRNAAMCAALLAAQGDRPIAMLDLVIGTWREIHKAGHLVQAHEFGAFRDDVVRYMRGGA